MSQELSGIVLSAVAIQIILSKLLQQQPNNRLLHSAVKLAKSIDHKADDLLWSGAQGGV